LKILCLLLFNVITDKLSTFEVFNECIIIIIIIKVGSEIGRLEQTKILASQMFEK